MSAIYEAMSPGGHEAYATSIFSKIKTYLDSNPYGYLTTHQDISGKADKTATVSTVTWSNNKLTKTINGTTSDVVSAATILGNLTSSQVTTALGYTPASVNTTYDFESPDDSISFNGRAVGSVVTVDMTVNGKVSTGGDTISGDYINTADFSEGGVTGKRVTTYGPWGIDIEEYVGTSLWSRLSLRDSDILLTKTWDGTNTSLKSSITSLRNDKVNRSGDTMSGQLKGQNPASSWIAARDNACFRNPNFANNGSYYPVISTKSKSGAWSMGVLSNEEQLSFCWESDSNYSSGKNESTRVILRATAGTIALTSELPRNSSSVIKVKSVNKTPTNAGTSLASPTPSIDTGYKFLCWLYVQSNGYVVGASYPGGATATNATWWFANGYLANYSLTFYYLEIKDTI